MSDQTNNEPRTLQQDRELLKHYTSYLEAQLVRIAKTADRLFIEKAFKNDADMRAIARMELAKVLNAFAQQHETEPAAETERK